MIRKITALILLLFISCHNKQDMKVPKQTDSFVVYNENDMYKIQTGKIKVIDTACINEEARAKKDIENGKLVLTFFSGFGYHEVSDAEMTALLSKYHITTKSVISPCSLPVKGFHWHCYNGYMNQAIYRKFGTKFTDSLRKVADRQFIQNHPNFLFDFDYCDTESRYAGAKTYDDFLKMPEDDFIKGLNFPKMTLLQRKKQKANTEVSFILYKNGSVAKIKAESDYDRATDKEFAQYFEKSAIEFVKNAKWIPAKYRGIKVNSEMTFNFYNK